MVDIEQIKTMLMGADLCSQDDHYTTSSKLSNYNRTHDRLKYRVSSGASKICLVFADLDFVIKWTCERYDDGDDEAFYEVDIYADAVAQKLDKFFPKTELWFSFGGINFIKQEKIDSSCYDLPCKLNKRYYKTGRTVTDEMVTKVQTAMNQIHGYRREIDEIWIKMCLSLYGKKAVKALCAFIQEHDINDLHSSNTGYKNNRPIILDFSGYHRD